MSAKPTTHSHALIAKVHAAAFANLARKVQEGKQLTNAEMKALNEAKRIADSGRLDEAEQIARDGLRVMAEIRRIILESKLAKAAKEEIFRELQQIETRCNDL
jgi:hypothetical protein